MDLTNRYSLHKILSGVAKTYLVLLEKTIRLDYPVRIILYEEPRKYD
jgi:hypothetical protein